MSTPLHPQTVLSGAVKVVSADTTANKTLCTAGASGAKIESISAASDDTSAVIFQIGVTISSVDYILGEVNVPITAGIHATGATKAVDILNSTDLPWVRNDGVNNYLLLPALAVLFVKAKTTVTAAKTVYFYAQGGNF